MLLVIGCSPMNEISDFYRHSSLCNLLYSNLYLAEGEGFEPSVRVASHTRFPSVPIKPLLHPSVGRIDSTDLNYISKLLQKHLAVNANKELN
jgi:hypothetical protein